jgi:AraC family transcriptional activator of pobA
MSHIPVHLLKERTNIGMQVKRFTSGLTASEERRLAGAHRDDHYIFFFTGKRFRINND